MSSRFSKEFKKQVVELFRQGGRTFTDLAKEFDLSPTTVANWARQDAHASGRLITEASADAEKAATDKAEIAELKRRLAQKEEELEILGKALAFFARRKDQ